jgi:hypothetical protein
MVVKNWGRSLQIRMPLYLVSCQPVRREGVASYTITVQERCRYQLTITDRLNLQYVEPCASGTWLNSSLTLFWKIG